MLSEIVQYLTSHSFKEDENVLRIFDFVYSVELHDYLLFLDKEVKTYDLGKLVIIDDLVNAPYALQDISCDDFLNNTVTIKLDKNVNNTVCFLTSRGFEEHLLNNSNLSDSYRLLFVDEAFSTKQVTFFPFSEANPKTSSSESRKIDLIQFTKPLNEYAQKHIITNVLQWVCDETVFSNTPTSWQIFATIKTICALSNEMYLEGDILELFFRGERRKSLKFDLTNRELFHEISFEVNEIVNWIYNTNKDVDSRHTIFNYQLVALLSDIAVFADVGIKDTLKTAFVNSKLAYQYHLYGSSKELNKILSDLNKSLYDYTLKIKQNTADLINTMWRDFIAVFGLLILNFSLKKPELPEVYYIVVGFVVSIYLVFNFLLSSKVHFWFYENLNKTLSEWKPKIYGYLSDDEYSTYALKPLKASQEKFEIIYYTLLIAYEFLIIIFLFSILDGISVVRFFCFLNGMKS